MLLFALFLQVIIPLNLFVVPIAYSGYAVVFNYYNQGINNLAMATGSTHGLCSTITMLLIHSPYRTAIFGVFEKTKKVMTGPSSHVSVIKF
ncbi:hypothetical protein L3Y34_009572 [Caenorhabditis briggsae]|nr:hypothetical protein L3Y34_009572 [Caenorhabditis briggsae]